MEKPNQKPAITKTDEEWKQQLSPLQYQVTRKGATEKPFTGKYNHFNKKGFYICICCENTLFSSEAKFNSGSGWPSFYKVINKEDVILQKDTSQ